MSGFTEWLLNNAIVKIPTYRVCPTAVTLESVLFSQGICLVKMCFCAVLYLCTKRFSDEISQAVVPFCLIVDLSRAYCALHIFVVFITVFGYSLSFY